MKLTITGPKWLIDKLWVWALWLCVKWWEWKMNRDIKYIMSLPPDETAEVLTQWRWSVSRLPRQDMFHAPMNQLVEYLTQKNNQRRSS